MGPSQSYYIQSMNPSNSAEEETKTIKYINNCNQNSSEKDQPSESPTEKLSPKQLPSLAHPHVASKAAKQGLVARKNNLALAQQRCRDQQGPGTARVHGHKKGKSMDLQELTVNKRKDKKGHGQSEISRERYRKYASNEINACLRDRNSISEMKHYHHHSKKLNNPKKTAAPALNPRRKKPKTINEGDVQEIQRELKKLIDETPVQIKPKKKANKLAQKTFHHNSCTLNNQKNTKKSSKSEEMLAQTDYKRTKKLSSDKRMAAFQKQSFSMPLTERIISLFSNPSSAYSSRKELERLPKDQPFVIPTEESLEEIHQIREYETVSLKKKNSDSLRHLKKLSPLRQRQAEDANSESHSTLNIVRLYLQKFKDMHELSLSRELQEISYIPEMTKSKSHQVEQQMMGQLDLAEIHNVSQQLQIKMQRSDELREPLNPLLLRQEQEIGRLDGLIRQLQKSQPEHLEQAQKLFFLNKIKDLIQTLDFKQKNASVQKHPPSQNSSGNLQPSPNAGHLQPSPNAGHSQLNANAGHLQPNTNNQLKQSLKSEEVISELNLQVLDKALRQRQSQLVRRKERQVIRAEEQFQRCSQGKDKTSMIKWIEHQIREVVQTRHQLWKGFYLATHVLKDPQIEKTSQKKKKMMKCLSDKYIKTHQFESIKTKAQKQHKGEANLIERKEGSKEELSEGRISESPYKKQKCVQSESDQIDIRVSSQGSQSQQLLITGQNYKQTCLNQFSAEKQDETSRPLENRQRNNGFSSEQNALKKAELQCPATGQVQRQQSIGLNLLQIECQLEEEESYNEQQLEALTKQSQKIKKESLEVALSVSVQDKEDIFEFIFLDLCIQLTDEYKGESQLMKKIFSFIRTMKEQSKKQKGFKTNSNAVKEYLYELISFLKGKAELLQQVQANMDKPLGPTALDILKYMHLYEEEPIEESNQTVFIMDLRVFQSFENAYLSKLQFEAYYADEEKERKRRAFLKNAMHIHNKAIFDALNQNLDKERPFGVWGEPFEWKRAAKFYRERTPLTKNNLILKCAQKTIQSGAYMCGFMVDKQDCSFKGNPNITQSYIDQIRDDRLSRMLANELQESEEKMLFIDDEQTEILVEVASIILQSLLAEASRELLSLT